MAQAAAPRVPLGATLGMREKLFLFCTLILCLFLTALDQSIVATALPHIAADLGQFDLAPWLITAYLLSSTITIPIAGKLGDMFGRKYFLLGGILLFVSASAACGAAPTMLFLIASRGIQGAGAGIIIAGVFGGFGDLLTPMERAKYFALSVGGFTFAALAGPALGGFFADGPGWRWCFYVNLPIGIIASSVITWRLPSGGGAGGRPSQIDFLGAGFLSGATIAFLLAIEWGGRAHGWLGGPTVGLVAAALTLGAAFVWQERRHPYAIIPLELFRNVPFTQAIAITIVQGGGVFAASQFLPTFVQTSLGGSATASGLVITVQAVGQLGSSILTGQLIPRTGKFKYQMVVGGAMMAVAALFMSMLQVGASTWHVVLLTSVMGIGGGLVFPVTQVVVQAAVQQDQQGIAGSTRQFFNQIAQTLGAAMFGLLLTAGYAGAFAEHSAPFAAALPASVLQQFQDPTIALEPAKFAELTAQVSKLPNGASILEQAQRAQRDSVADATDGMYRIVLGAALVILVIAILFREFVLRRTFDVSEPDIG